MREGSSGSPKDDAAPAESAVAEPAAEASAPPAEPVAGAPKGAETCWGSDFQPSAEKCKGCEHKESCMEKYIEG